MKLNVLAPLKSILGFGKRAEVDPNRRISMVLLLREPKFCALETLRSTAERAFKVRFSDEKESTFFVMKAGLSTLMKVGRHTMSFVHVSRPYGQSNFRSEFAKSLSKEGQRRAWNEHRAWSAVDYVKSGKDPELEYAVLATICVDLVDDNCIGLYMPRELRIIQNDDSLAQELLRISNSRPLELT